MINWPFALSKAASCTFNKNRPAPTASLKPGEVRLCRSPELFFRSNIQLVTCDLSCSTALPGLAMSCPASSAMALPGSQQNLRTAGQNLSGACKCWEQSGKGMTPLSSARLEPFNKPSSVLGMAPPPAPVRADPWALSSPSVSLPAADPWALSPQNVPEPVHPPSWVRHSRSLSSMSLQMIQCRSKTCPRWGDRLCVAARHASCDTE